MRRLLCLGGFFSLSLCGVLAQSMPPVMAACDALPSDKGQDSGSISVQMAGTYTVWLRMSMPTNDANSVSVQLDDACPVVVGGDQSGAGFRWVKYGAPVSLATGTHKIVLAGHEAGAGVDRVIAVADSGCAPTGVGDNCLNAAALPATLGSNGASLAKTPPSVTVARVSPAHLFWLSVGIGLAVLATGGFLLWNYHFRRPTSIIHALPSEITVARFRIPLKFLHIVHHPKLVIAVYAVLMIVAFTVAIAAADTQPVFEAETGTLSGGAKVESTADASAGMYVSFHANPVGSNGKLGTKAGSSGGTGSSGGSTSGGSGGTSSGDSSGGTNSGSCALPKYPAPSCTGAPSGTSFTTYNGDYYARTNGETINATHITGNVLILANNVTITNSEIDGTIYNDQGTLHGSFTVTDTTIGPASGCISQPAINDSNYVARRVRSRGHDDGFRIGPPGNVEVYDSYVDNCYLPPSEAPPDGSHSDGVQAVCGGDPCSRAIIVHNTFDGTHVPTTNMLNLTDTELSDVTATDNLLAGAGYTVDTWWHSGAAWVISNNRFVNNSWAYGPVSTESTCSHQSWSGNTLVTIDSSYNILSTVGPQGCVD